MAAEETKERRGGRSQFGTAERRERVAAIEAEGKCRGFIGKRWKRVEEDGRLEGKTMEYLA